MGGITTRETEAARDDGLEVSGDGYYLFLAEVGAPQTPVQLLAKFFSPFEADAFAKVLRRLAPAHADGSSQYAVAR